MECKYRCHRECEPQVPHSCGLPEEFVNFYVNQMQQGNVPNMPSRLPQNTTDLFNRMTGIGHVSWICPSSLKTASNSNKSQQIIVIPQNMLVNGCISVNGLKKIIDNNEATIKSAEQRGNLKRPASSSSITAEDSTYGSDSEGSEHNVDGKPVRKRANLDHLSPEEKLMRRKLKNRVAAQNARDKKRTKMEEMEAELLRLKVN